MTIEGSAMARIASRPLDKAAASLIRIERTTMLLDNEAANARQAWRRGVAIHFLLKLPALDHKFYLLDSSLSFVMDGEDIVV